MDGDGNIIKHHNDDFTDIDADENANDETIEVDNDRSSSPKPDNDTKNGAPHEVTAKLVPERKLTKSKGLARITPRWTATSHSKLTRMKRQKH